MRILIAAIAFNQSDSLDDAEPMCIALKTVPAHVWKSCERLGCAVAKSDCSDAASCVEHTRSFSATAACKKAIGRPSEYTLVEHTSDAVRVSPARLDSPGLHWCFLTNGCIGAADRSSTMHVHVHAPASADVTHCSGRRG